MVKGGEYWRISDIRRQPPYIVDQVDWPGNYPRSINQYWQLGKVSAELKSSTDLFNLKYCHDAH